jgi:hypothetical protein
MVIASIIGSTVALATSRLHPFLVPKEFAPHFTS